MATNEITPLEFESIVDKLEIKEVSIDVHLKSQTDIDFPIIDIGTLTHCESPVRKVAILRFRNETGKQITDKIRLEYNPVVAIKRNCLFVKPDDVIQDRLESILDDMDSIRFFFIDMSHSKSLVNAFKDGETQESILPYDIPTLQYDVVIIFYTEIIRKHLRQIEMTYDMPFVGIGQETLDSRKQKIVTKYMTGFGIKHVFMILIVVTILISIVVSFNAEDVNSSKIQSENSEITE